MYFFVVKNEVSHTFDSIILTTFFIYFIYVVKKLSFWYTWQNELSIFIVYFLNVVQK